MSILSENDQEIVSYLLPRVIELAMEHDNLIEPDEETQRIIIRVLGVGFSIGQAYNQTKSELHWRKRLKEAFKLLSLKE